MRGDLPLRGQTLRGQALQPPRRCSLGAAKGGAARFVCHCERGVRGAVGKRLGAAVGRKTRLGGFPPQRRPRKKGGGSSFPAAPREKKGGGGF